MRLCTYDAGAGPKAGVLQGELVLDAAALLGETAGLSDIRALLELPNRPLERLRNALSRSNAPVSAPLDNLRLLSPVLQPPTIRDFMVYEGHATRNGTRPISEAWYRLPVFYFSNPLRMFGPEDVVPYPSASSVLDYELELAVVMAQSAGNIRESEAMDYVAGFTIFNDWSSRDLQADEMAVGLGPAKGKDSAQSLGPVIVTPDEFGERLRDGHLALRCTLKVNGVEWVSSDGGRNHHTWGAMIERASRDSRVAAGDVLGGGTVAGGSIAEAILGGKPARYLQPGDVVEVEVEMIGALRNTIGPPTNADANYRFKAKEGVFEIPRYEAS